MKLGAISFLGTAILAFLATPVSQAMAQLSVDITVGTDRQSSSVHVSGEVQHLITPHEREVFKLTDSQLKKAVAAHFGKQPNDAFLTSPTPWNDLYKRYHWPEVKVHLRPTHAQILEITSTPDIVATNRLENKSDKPGTFHANVTQQLSNSMSTTWSQTYGIGVGRKVSVGANLSGIAIGAERSLSLNAEFGKSKTESSTFTAGTEQGVKVELDPGEAVDANLTVSRGEMKIRVFYEAYLTGSTAVNYNPPFKGHHFWGLNIHGVMQAAGLKHSYEVTQDITIGFFTNADVVMKPAATS